MYDVYPVIIFLFFCFIVHLYCSLYFLPLFHSSVLSLFLSSQFSSFLPTFLRFFPLFFVSSYTLPDNSSMIYNIYSVHDLWSSYSLKVHATSVNETVVACRNTFQIFPMDTSDKLHERSLIVTFVISRNWDTRYNRLKYSKWIPLSLKWIHSVH